jgi:hypothetical protein
MASVGGLISNLSGKIVEETSAQFQKEQAVLLAKSYTEYAIMAVMANDRNVTGVCVQDIDGVVVAPGGTITSASTNGQGYDVRVNIGFIGKTGQIQACDNTREFGSPANASPDELNIIVDTYVRYKDLSQADPSTSPWITYHRRTLQKI